MKIEVFMSKLLSFFITKIKYLRNKLSRDVGSYKKFLEYTKIGELESYAQVCGLHKLSYHL